MHTSGPNVSVDEQSQYNITRIFCWQFTFVIFMYIHQSWRINQNTTTTATTTTTCTIVIAANAVVVFIIIMMIIIIITNFSSSSCSSSGSGSSSVDKKVIAYWFAYMTTQVLCFNRSEWMGRHDGSLKRTIKSPHLFTNGLTRCNRWPSQDPYFCTKPVSTHCVSGTEVVEGCGLVMPSSVGGILPHWPRLSLDVDTPIGAWLRHTQMWHSLRKQDEFNQ